MSARLFKGGAEAALPAFVAFTIPCVDEVTPAAPFSIANRLGPSACAALDGHSAEAAVGASLQADAILARAHADAERMLADARAGAAEIEREARDRAISEARASVAIEINLAVEPLRDRLAETLSDLSSLHEVIGDRAERDVLRLAIEIAKKIVHRETTLDSEIAMTLVRVALGRLHNRAVAHVHLHPDDFAYVTTRADRLVTSGSVELVEDHSILRGGCLVRTEMGDVDARIDQQFAEIERELIGLSS